MGSHRLQKKSDLFGQIKWVIITRVIFAVLLIISCLVFSSGENLSFFSQPFLALYNLAALILLLSVVYIIWLNRFKKLVLLAYVQTLLDTFIVTGIILVTGSYDSIFTFLYLVVIIYSAMMLLRKGSVIIATVSSVLYSLLLELEYYNVITPYLKQFYFAEFIDPAHIIYRIIIFIAACFAVAILSGILAFQLKGARQDLKLVQEHLKRVERMEVMDELISGIAHEIKNPLASLSGSIQMLKEDTKPGSYEDKLMQIILRETERLKTIVNDIHLFSKPSTKNARVIKMAEVIEET
ncbi:MAG: two-component sensor histidine kinase, partial [Proteobacteria bacterium]|nr:two-component sensor histidine kinase [Pseudomonadota bacterium]